MFRRAAQNWNSIKVRFAAFVGFLCLILTASSAFSATDTTLPAFDCVINPNQIVDISSPVPGVVEAIYVERSDYVEKGQIIAKLAAGVEEASVELARARANLDPEINVGELNVAYDQKRQTRIESLYGKKVVSIEDKDDADKEARISQWRLQQAKDLQDVRALELKRAEALLAQKTIKSTLSGFVVQRYKSQGEYVEDQPIVRIAQLDPLRVEAIIPMKLFGKIAPGMTATVHAESSNSEHDATVTIVDPIGDPGSATFGIRLSMANPDFLIQGGTRCEFKFTSSALSQHVPEATSKINEAILVNQDKVPVQVEAVEPIAASTDSRLVKTPETATLLGPYSSFSAAQKERQRLADDSVQSTLIERETTQTGYLVLSSDEDNSRLNARLKQLDITDHGTRRVAPYSGRISFGYFTSEANAGKRVNHLNQLGIDSEIKPLSRHTSQFWLQTEINDVVTDPSLERFATHGAQSDQGGEGS